MGGGHSTYLLSELRTFVTGRIGGSYESFAASREAVSHPALSHAKQSLRTSGRPPSGHPLKIDASSAGRPFGSRRHWSSLLASYDRGARQPGLIGRRLGVPRGTRCSLACVGRSVGPANLHRHLGVTRARIQRSTPGHPCPGLSLLPAYRVLPALADGGGEPGSAALSQPPDGAMLVSAPPSLVA